MNDLCTVLEKYRAENQNMMSQKDREIESLREQLQESEVAKVHVHISVYCAQYVAYSYYRLQSSS